MTQTRTTMNGGGIVGPRLRETASSRPMSLFGSSSAPHVHKNETVGASCLLLFFAALFPWANGDYLTGSLASAVSIFSIMADFVYVNHPSAVWHDIDRLAAGLFTAWIVYLGATNDGLATSLFRAVTFGAIPFSYSRASGSKEEWAIRHSLFHVCSAVALYTSLQGVYAV